MKNKKLQMIGNAHLDPVWLWNWQEGFQEVKATFRSALDRMTEDENFVFSCSSSAFYEWVEKNNPQMFQEIQERVAEGRWEIVGGWYIQPDCNIPSGESFVRQALYAQRYFQNKFGKMATTGYNVDSFGHHANLPQILKKSGMDHYVFMRPMPLEKSLPSRIFHWNSPDGSSVLSYRIPFEYCTWGNLEKYVNRLKTELQDSEDYLMLFYGVGNHGGGPTKDNIADIYELNKRSDTPHMVMGTIEEFFSEVGKKEHPHYIGDLQHHASGCYSAHSQIKQQNRDAEHMLITAESWSAVADVVKNQPYPDNFDRAWKGILFNQFHDILAGTSIQSAYKDASYLFGQAMAIGQENLNYAVQAITWDVHIEEDLTMKPIVVCNPHPWSGKMVVELEVRGLSSDDFYVTDHEGTVIPAQRIQSEATVLNQSRLLFVAELPSLGYSLFKLYEKSIESANSNANVAVTDTTLENQQFRLEFNPENGCIKSFYDKQVDLEILRREGGRIAIIEDTSDTWAHNIFSFQNEVGNMALESMRIVEQGPVRSTLRVKSIFNNSSVIQDFRLYNELDYVEVVCKVDWKEPQKIAKIKYPVYCNFRKPTYEIPYGFLERHANGEEEPGQSWIDLSGEHFEKETMYGLAIANSAKYSYDCTVDEIGLTIVRNSVYAHHMPKELESDTEYAYVDQGMQTFSYLLLPHKNSWKESPIIQRSQELQRKAIPIIETYHKGDLPQTNSFISLESDHAVISAVKKSEDGKSLIVRMYETHKTEASGILKVPFLNREIALTFSPCEIKTVRIPYNKKQSITEVNLLEFAHE